MIDGTCNESELMKLLDFLVIWSSLRLGKSVILPRYAQKLSQGVAHGSQRHGEG